MKEVSVVNKKDMGETGTQPYAIVCSGFSGRHLYSTSKRLCNEVKSVGCDIANLPKVLGRKDDSWFLVVIKDV